jgi:hypothetical protein
MEIEICLPIEGDEQEGKRNEYCDKLQKSLLYYHSK